MIGLYVFCDCSLYIKHHNLFGRSEKLDVSWDKGLDESSVFIAYRKPRPEWLPQQSFTIQVFVFFLETISSLRIGQMESGM